MMKTYPLLIFLLNGYSSYNSDMDEFIDRVRRDFPQYKFCIGKKFAFRPPRTIFFEPIIKNIEENDDKNSPKNKLINYKYEQQYKMQLLHELGHAECKHKDFATSMDRLKKEREAWEKAREFGEKYQIEFDEDFIEEKLDTYRDWQHQKSTCPKCGQTRLEKSGGEFVCPLCDLI